MKLPPLALGLLVSCLAVGAGSSSARPCAYTSSAEHTFTITSGPTTGTKPFPDGGSHAAVSIAGKIEPPLPPTTVGNVTQVELDECSSGNTTQEITAGDYQGGANGASFTCDVKQSALKAGCRRLKVTYELSNGATQIEEEVTFANPNFRKTAGIDFGSVQVVEGMQYSFPVQVLDHEGAIDAAFTGQIHVSASSLQGSRVKMNGSYGTTVVEVVDGVGTIAVECVRAIPGDTLIFDLTGMSGRVNPSRSSVDLH